VRLIQLRVPDPERDAVTDVLADRDIDYVVTTEERDEETAALVQFPLPAAAVDEMLDELASAGLDPDRYTVVTSVETSRPEGQSYPSLAGNLERQIRRAIDEEATVEVTFTDRRTAG